MRPLLLAIIASLALEGSASATTLVDDRVVELAKSQQWLRLGHWKRSLFGGHRSEVVGGGFFLAPEGATSPVSELRATVHAMQSPGLHQYRTPFEMPDEQHPLCQFPARFEWLKQNHLLDLEAVRRVQKTIDCKRFEDFKRTAAAKSVSVVFSAYRINNPSSAFGHSLLRLNKGTTSEDGEHHELLDQGINFAADASTSNPVSYVFNGLFGGFKGLYSAVPYFYKVREYDDFESRDLWSYDLGLDPAELEMLLAHLWELGTATFNYFYLSQNCSYQILTAIEAAAPRFSITEKLPFYVIPADTIRQMLKTPGLVTRISHRASARSQFDALASGFSMPEMDALQRMVIQRDILLPPVELAVESRARVLDSALGFVDYRFPKELLDPKSEAAQWKQELLVARAGLGIRSKPVEVVPDPRSIPHIGHESARAAVDFGRDSTRGNFVGAQMRFALHDLVDPAPGYPAHSQVEFFNLKIRAYDSGRKPEIDDFALIRIFSLSPLAPMSREKSWRVELGARTLRDSDCDRCLSGFFELGGGAAVSPWGNSGPVLLALGELKTEFAPSFAGSSIRLGVGPSLGLVQSAGPLTGMIRAGYQRRVFSFNPHALSATADLRWNRSEAFALGLGLRGWINGVSSQPLQRSWDGTMAAYFYF
jgi:hypothetical protein